jgi:hypothetical protein
LVFFVAAYERSCLDSFIVRARVDAFAITPDGQVSFFADLGLVTMSEALRLARQSRCGNN